MTVEGEFAAKRIAIHVSLKQRPEGWFWAYALDSAGERTDKEGIMIFHGPYPDLEAASNAARVDLNSVIEHSKLENQKDTLR